MIDSSICMPPLGKIVLLKICISNRLLEEFWCDSPNGEECEIEITFLHIGPYWYSEGCLEYKPDTHLMIGFEYACDNKDYHWDNGINRSNWIEKCEARVDLTIRPHEIHSWALFE